jgi:hypothetical protein
MSDYISLSLVFDTIAILINFNDNILFCFWSSRAIDQPTEIHLSIENQTGKHVHKQKRNRVCVCVYMYIYFFAGPGFRD